MVHGIDGHGAIGVEPAELDHFGLLLLSGQGVELLQIRRDTSRKVLFAKAYGDCWAFRFHGGKVRKGERRSKVLWLEVANDGGGIPHRDLDVGF